MVFHWLKVYGKHRQRATAVVEDVFARARDASTSVFATDSLLDANRKAKFEHVCLWLARELAARPEAEWRPLMEAIIDRVEISLRENGVSDMRVGNEVRAYAAAMNGRVQRYVPLIKAQEIEALAVALAEHGIATDVACAVLAAA